MVKIVNFVYKTILKRKNRAGILLSREALLACMRPWVPTPA
jgi:hypothetical protein